MCIYAQHIVFPVCGHILESNDQEVDEYVCLEECVQLRLDRRALAEEARLAAEADAGTDHRTPTPRGISYTGDRAARTVIKCEVVQFRNEIAPTKPSEDGKMNCCRACRAELNRLDEQWTTGLTEMLLIGSEVPFRLRSPPENVEVITELRETAAKQLERIIRFGDLTHFENFQKHLLTAYAETKPVMDWNLYMAILIGEGAANFRYAL